MSTVPPAVAAVHVLVIDDESAWADVAELLAGHPGLRQSPCARDQAAVQELAEEGAAVGAVVGGAVGGVKGGVKGAVVGAVEGPAPISEPAARLCREILAAEPDVDVRHVCSGDVGWAVAEFQLLSARERQVLELIAEGLTNREIAEKLFLAEKTVKNYVSRLLGKLGMSRRTQAAVYVAGMRHG